MAQRLGTLDLGDHVKIPKPWVSTFKVSNHLVLEIENRH